MIIQADARAIPLRDASVQCVVTLPARLLIQLKGSELREEFVGGQCELFWEALKMWLSVVLSGRSETSSECVQFEAQINLSTFPLHVRTDHPKQSKSFLLRKAKPVIWKSASASVLMDNLRGRQERIYKSDGFWVGHRQFKTNHIGRSATAMRHFPLDSDVAFSIYHPGEVTNLPSFHFHPPCVCSLRTHIVSEAKGCAI